MNKSSIFRALVILVLMLSSFVTCNAIGFKNKSSIVIYCDTLVITKEMFKAKPVNNSYMISTAFCFDYKEENDSVIMNVYSCMDKNNSNPAKNCIFENWVLRHELYHLKIAEIWARIFSAKLSSKFACKKIKKKSFYRYLKKQYKTHFKASTQMQALYDLETNHSKIKDKQKEWEAKIDKMLEEYKDYANKEIVIKLK